MPLILLTATKEETCWLEEERHTVRYVHSHVITCLVYIILLFFTSALKFYEVKVSCAVYLILEHVC